MISTASTQHKKLNIAIIGARSDGHAGVILDALSYCSWANVVVFFDRTSDKKNNKINGIPIAGDINKIQSFKDIKIDAFHVAIGDNKARYDIYQYLESMNFPLLTVIHPTAIISSRATIGNGCFVGANAVIQNNSEIGNYTLINTSTIIDHDNIIGEAVHIAPSACTAGRVKIGDFSFLGIGSLVTPDVTIGKSSFINAGALIKKNVKDGLTMVGYASKVHFKNIYSDLGNF